MTEKDKEIEVDLPTACLHHFFLCCLCYLLFNPPAFKRVAIQVQLALTIRPGQYETRHAIGR